jgi:hypothetical protein
MYTNIYIYMYIYIFSYVYIHIYIYINIYIYQALSIFLAEYSDIKWGDVAVTLQGVVLFHSTGNSDHLLFVC